MTWHQSQEAVTVVNVDGSCVVNPSRGGCDGWSAGVDSRFSQEHWVCLISFKRSQQRSSMGLNLFGRRAFNDFAVTDQILRWLLNQLVRNEEASSIVICFPLKKHLSATSQGLGGRSRTYTLGEKYVRIFSCEIGGLLMADASLTSSFFEGLDLCCENDFFLTLLAYLTKKISIFLDLHMLQVLIKKVNFFCPLFIFFQPLTRVDRYVTL